ncbi:MAG: BBP7 family outer membrane beta-barrel protein [Planctomycetaceae bacterium]|nr:BBP7 family outer membrane beta-barrel protein [Planctomycetaceae bacterium]
MKPWVLLLALALAASSDAAWGQRAPHVRRPANPPPTVVQAHAAPQPRTLRPTQQASFDEYVMQEGEQAIEGDGGVVDRAPEPTYFNATELDGDGFAPAFGQPCATCGGRCPGDCRRHNYLSPLNGGWANFDYLVWWGKGTNLPPLVTTSPVSSQGILDAPGTQVLFGNQTVDAGARSGGRIDAGIWLDREQEFGVGASFLGIQRAATAYNATSKDNGTPLYARPFFDVDTGANNAQVVSNPGITRGSINVQTANTILGAEAYLRERLLEEPGFRLDCTYGYRLFRMDESVDIYDSTIVIEPNGNIPLGTELAGTDVFNTHNTFQGGQIGLSSRAERGCWGWDWWGKIAVGNIYQVAEVYGNNRLTVPGGPTLNRAGSLYTQPTNIGTYTRNVFGFLPEIGATIHYQFTPLWRVKFGYSFLYLNNVLQASQIIDQNVNPTQIDGPLVGPAQPALSFSSNSYWLQGINVGLECNF